MAQDYDAILVVSFGGPEGPQDVLPFLENVLAGKDVPRQRLLEVAAHYEHFGGTSPINAQNRALVSALQRELSTHGPNLPVFWGNRNWHPLLQDTLAQMAAANVRHALALATSAFSSYSSCRQYLEDIERARHVVGSGAPRVDKLRAFFNHPLFIRPMVEQVKSALQRIPAERRPSAQVIYTAHSIPLSMADHCDYVVQLQEAAHLVSTALNIGNFQLAYQSRSGPPGQPWLEPDVSDVLRRLHAERATNDVVVVPLGFLSDHIEVLWDLDFEAGNLAKELGLNLVRAATVGNHPDFVAMIRELIEERTSDAERRTLGSMPARPDQCAADCCQYAPRKPTR